MCCYTAMVAEYAGTSNRVGNAMRVFFIFAFMTPYAGCLDASSYVYCSEIFPTAIRAHGVGFSVSGLFLSNISMYHGPIHEIWLTQPLPVYTQTAPTAFNNVGWKYFLVFILMPAVGTIFFVKYYPETKGLSLEEVHIKDK